MFIKNNNIVLRSIHEKYFLIDITDNHKDDICNIYELNDIGMLIWNSCEKEIDVISRIIIDKIEDDIDINIIRNDVKEYIEELIEKGFLLDGRT